MGVRSASFRYRHTSRQTVPGNVVTARLSCKLLLEVDCVLLVATGEYDDVAHTNYLG